MVELLKFETKTCQQCKLLNPVLDQIKQEYPNVVSVKKIDSEENMKLAFDFNIRSVPVIIFLKDGKEFDRIYGFTNKNEIMKRILN